MKACIEPVYRSIFHGTHWKQAMPKQMIRHLKLAGILAMLLPSWMSLTQAQVLDATVRTETKINKDAAASQKHVDELAKQTQDLLADYRSVLREIESLKIYNGNLEKMVADQHNEVDSINRAL